MNHESFYFFTVTASLLLFLVVHSSILGQSPIWSRILIFVYSTIWRDFSKRLRSHCISSRLSRLQWIEKSPHKPNTWHSFFAFCCLFRSETRPPEDDEEEEEEILGSDDDEQEDPKDYVKGMDIFRIIYLKFIYSEQATEIWNNLLSDQFHNLDFRVTHRIIWLFLRGKKELSIFFGLFWDFLAVWE